MNEQEDLLAGLALRDIAHDTQEVVYKDWLQDARAKAYAHAVACGTVCSDDVHRLSPVPPWVHHNAMGAVFRDKRFKIAGWVQSKRPSAHARTIRIYHVD
jgi:hypothetical protein